MTRRKSDVVAVADWSFLEDKETMDAVGLATARACKGFPAADREDVRQDILLWLSVRPDYVDRQFSYWPCEGEFTKYLGSKLYTHAVRKKLIKSTKEVPTDDLST